MSVCGSNKIVDKKAEKHRFCHFDHLILKICFSFSVHV